MGTCVSIKTHQTQNKIIKEQQEQTQNDLIVDPVIMNQNKITKEYRIWNDPIGIGSYGEVRKGTHLRTKQNRAIKIIYRNQYQEDNRDQIIREIKILQKLDHPNIVKIYEYFEDKRFFYIVMELLNDGELFERIVEKKLFDEKEAQKIMFDILRGVNYLHKQNIVHRDLKPENILFDEGVLKIVDFGTSKFQDPKKKMKNCHGTPYYIAPEVFQGSYDLKCDTWSCGVILYIMLSGVPPFNGKDKNNIIKSVKRGKYTLNIKEFANISESAKDLIRKMLTLEATQRPTIEECLQHEWFEKNPQDNKEINNKFLENIKNFNIESKIQKSLYFFLVNHLQNKKERKELLQTFKKLDKNNDGVLSKDELLEGLKLIDSNITDADVQRILLQIDNNKNCTLDYTEFVVAATNRKEILSNDKVRNCFQIIDKDRSGKISIQELKDLFQKGHQIKEDVLKSIIEDDDQNKDGEIDFEEFKNILMKIASQLIFVKQFIIQMKNNIDSIFTAHSEKNLSEKINEHQMRYSMRSVSVQSNVYSVVSDKESLSKGGLLSTQNFVIIVSLFYGFYHISNLALFMYQKNQLQIDPETIQLIQGLISIPWCIKPVFGYIFDQIISKYKKTKNIIIITSIVRIILFTILAHFVVSTRVFFVISLLINFAALFENIVCEYLLLISTKRANFESDQNQNHITIFYGFKAFGAIIGVFFGGRIIDNFGNQKCFYINSILPLFAIFFTFLYLERPHRQESKEKRTIKQEIQILHKLVFRGKIFYMILFVCLINMTPSFNSLSTFYLTDVLKFTSEDLSDFSTFGTIFYMLGLITYSTYFVNANQKQFFVITNFILWFISISYFLVVFGIVEQFNINVKLFCLISQGFSSFVSEINFMPILTIWCAMSPNKLEATSITFFTGLMNLSNNLSNYFGIFVMWLMTVDYKNYKQYWVLLFIQNAYLLIMIIAIIFVDFPDIKQQKKIDLSVQQKKQQSLQRDLEKPLDSNKNNQLIILIYTQNQLKLNYFVLSI